MKKSFVLFCAVVLFSGLVAAPAAAGEKLEVQILGPSDLSGTGTFEVLGEAADLLCPSGTLESANTEFKWLSEDTFKIRQDKLLTCDGTGEILVLELSNTINLDEGSIPGKGTWKLKDSTGFDPAPKGKGDIVVVESEPGLLVEAYVGLLTFK